MIITEGSFTLLDMYIYVIAVQGVELKLRCFMKQHELAKKSILLINMENIP